MTVTVLTPSLSREAGGIFEVEHRLAQELDQFVDVDVRVVGLDNERTAEDLSEWAPLEPTVLPTYGPDAFGYSPKLVDTLLQTGADIVHLHALWMYTSWAVRQWSRKSGQPYIVSPHGMLDEWALNNSHWKKQIAGWLFENESLRRAGCLHALNEKEYQSIRNYGLERPICVIPNGVEVPSAEDSPVSPPWEDTFEASTSVLLFLGRLHPKKGLAELIDAWKAAAPVLEDWRLAIVGWGDEDYVSSLRHQIRGHGLENRVALLGPSYGEEKASALEHASGFVLPSFSEGFPMAVLEAWSYRLPVLMTPHCNLPDGFEEGAAYRVDPEPKSIAEGLQDFVQFSDEEREEMGINGWELVCDQYTWPKIAQSVRAVYRWMLDDSPRPPCVKVD